MLGIGWKIDLRAGPNEPLPVRNRRNGNEEMEFAFAFPERLDEQRLEYGRFAGWKNFPHRHRHGRGGSEHAGLGRASAIVVDARNRIPKSDAAFTERSSGVAWMLAQLQRNSVHESISKGKGADDLQNEYRRERSESGSEKRKQSERVAICELVRRLPQLREAAVSKPPNSLSGAFETPKAFASGSPLF